MPVVVANDQKESPECVEVLKVSMNALGFPGGAMVMNLLAMQETQVSSLGREDPLEKGMVTHSSTPAWKIPWTEEPGRLQSMGSQRVGHD